MSTIVVDTAVEVESRTWARETHNLFDFEANPSTITEQAFTMKESSTCIRAGDGVEVCPGASSESSSGESESLIQVEFRQGKAFLNRPRWNGPQNDRRVQRCWKLIRNKEEGSGHRLSKNDIVKFGRSQFKVRQLAVKAEAIAFDDKPCDVCHINPAEFEQQSEQQCRICLEEGSTEEDPLLAPCQCRGSISHVHLGCLRHWLRDRLSLANGDAAFVVGGTSNPMSCELCKTAYQTTVMMGHKKLPLVDLGSPFVVLESCSDHRLHILPIVNGQPVKIGRGHECNMNIQDTSISRVQASITFADGVFTLNDQGSRFGTYVKITKQMPLEVGQQFSVQVGRTILQLSTKHAKSSTEPPTPEGSLQGDDTDMTESPRGSLARSSRSGDFMSCDGEMA